MTHPASDLVALSALQHYLFCPRQCALIHVEQIWAENILTAEGRILHEKADSGHKEKRGGVKIVTGLPLRSWVYGLVGRADVVEFHKNGKIWQPFPVEYKRGRPKAHQADKIQLCGQALCLEEMVGQPILEGALFYGQTRRREAVAFTDDLRRLTLEVADKVHELLATGQTPPPVADKRCQNCSLIEQCLPQATGPDDSSARYLEKMRLP